MPDFPKTVFTLSYRIDYYASEDGPCCVTGEIEAGSAADAYRAFAKRLDKYPVVFRTKVRTTRQSFLRWHKDLWESVDHGYPRDAAMDRVRRVSGLQPLI